MQITAPPHPKARLAAFVTRFPSRLGELPPTAGPATELLRLEAPAPLQRDEGVRQAVRDMLRHGGYKPTGRGKPASEYLSRAAEEGTLEPINPAVDACNVVSLHSGLPISVVDLELARPPFRIGLGTGGERYVFNRAGQEIDVSGLLCLYDAEGACANAVRDSQRTKTKPETTTTLSIVWGVDGYEERVQQAVTWYRELLAALGAETEMAEFVESDV